MIDITGLREDKRPQSPIVVHAILDRLEAAEKERDALRAKIAEMEKQEPVAKVRVHQTGGNAGLAWSVAPLNDFDSLPLMRDGDRLYALPGAQAQNAPKAAAYLDLGVGGYIDIGTDLTDEELAALPKGRHMLGVIGTYGVDGYVPAQPALSVPDADELAHFIRRIDGAHDLGASALAEKIVDWLAAAPEAKP